MENYPKRKPNRLKEFDYTEDGAYFITICTKNKEKILSVVKEENEIEGNELALTDIGKAVDQSIKQIPSHYEGVYVDKYVVMPNHVHLIIRLEGQKNGRMVSAPTIIGGMKKHVSKTLGKQIWQKGFYDHVIRDESDYLKVWKYIDDNPHKWNVDEYFI